MKLLLTAFDPFGGEKINPALEAVKRVQDKIGDLEIVKLEVPTVFYKSIDTVTLDRGISNFTITINGITLDAEIY